METLTVKDSKIAYNKNLERWKKAEEYFENPKITQAEKEKFMSDFENLLKAQNQLLRKIGIYSQENILQGFKI